MIFFYILLLLIPLLPMGSIKLLKQTSLSRHLHSKRIYTNIKYLIIAELIVIIFATLPPSLNIPPYTNIAMHFFGGGFVVGFLFFYFKDFLKYSLPKWIEIVILYFFVSGFGVASELLEFLLHSFTSTRYSTSVIDTWKDLLANTTGVFTLYSILTLWQHINKEGLKVKLD